MGVWGDILSSVEGWPGVAEDVGRFMVGGGAIGTPAGQDVLGRAGEAMVRAGRYSVRPGAVAETLGAGRGGAATPKGKGKAKAKKAADPTLTAAQREAAIANSPWAKLMRGLEQTYQAEEVPVAAAISGSGTVPAQNAAMNQALALAGGSPSGAAFLSNAQAQANAATAPVQAAMAQQGAQYAAEQGPISRALAAYGNANELMLQTAPESAWLSALASHVTSNLSYYGEVPKSVVSGLPSSLVTAMQQTGGYPGQAGQGLVPLSSLKPTAGGGVTIGRNTSPFGAGTTGLAVPTSGLSGGTSAPTG